MTVKPAPQNGPQRDPWEKLGTFERRNLLRTRVNENNELRSRECPTIDRKTLSDYGFFTLEVDLINRFVLSTLTFAPFFATLQGKGTSIRPA